MNVGRNTAPTSPEAQERQALDDTWCQAGIDPGRAIVYF